MEVVEVVEMVSVRLVLEVQVSNEGVRKVHIDRRITDGEEKSNRNRSHLMIQKKKVSIYCRPSIYARSAEKRGNAAGRPYAPGL